jgi:phage I-like protein
MTVMNTRAALRTAAHTFELTAADAAATPAAPAWVQLLPASPFAGRDGRGPYRTHFAAVLGEFSANGLPLPIDYEHQTLNAASNGQPAPAAGWIEALQARDDGLWGQVAWTPRAAERIAQREYRYLSPVFDHTEAGEIIRLTSAALVNTPNLTLTALNQAHALPLTAPESPMKQKLITLLALAADATPEQVFAAAHARLTAPPDPDPARVALEANFATALQRLAALEGQAASAAIEALVAEGRAAHKLTPAMDDSIRQYARLDLAAATAHVASLPVIGLASAAHQAAPAAHPVTPAVNPLVAEAERRAAAARPRP